jgi:zinc protease
VLNQVSQFANPDYFTDEQLKDAKAIMLRNIIHNREKPSSLPSQASSNWCSTSLTYYTDLDDNYQKVTREDIVRYIKKYIAGKPMVAGLIINPELNKQINAGTFFAAQ